MVQPLGRVETYFKLNKLLLSLIGVWPYQTPRESWLAMSILFCVAMSQLIPQIIALTKVRHDMDMVIECMTPLGLAVLSVIKLANLKINNYKMKDLLVRIQTEWDSAISPQEITIIKRYSEYSRKLSKIYTTIDYTLGVVFLLQPLVEAKLMANPALNSTKSTPRRLPFIAEYYIDKDKYYYQLMFHSFITTAAFVTIITSADSMFVVYIQQGCAKFEILKYRLSQAIEPGKLNVNIYPLEIDDLPYKNVKACLRLHKEAMGFVNAIESSYTTAQLCQVGVYCLLISFIGLHVVTKLNNPDQLLTYFGMIFSVILHLLFYSWPSHELMDQSVSVCEAASGMEWYRASIRTRKLLLQMMNRSLKTCQITAGKLYPMSMENFTSILSSSVSCFTMLSSVQK